MELGNSQGKDILSVQVERAYSILFNISGKMRDFVTLEAPQGWLKETTVRTILFSKTLYLVSNQTCYSICGLCLEIKNGI